MCTLKSKTSVICHIYVKHTNGCNTYDNKVTQTCCGMSGPGVCVATVDIE